MGFRIADFGLSVQFRSADPAIAVSLLEPQAHCVDHNLTAASGNPQSEIRNRRIRNPQSKNPQSAIRNP